MNEIIVYRDSSSGQIIYNLITKERYFQKPTYQSIHYALDETNYHAIANNIRCIAMPKIACGLDKMDWKEVSKIIVDVFRFSGITIYVYVPGWELNSMPALEVFDTESVSEIFEQIGSDIVQACNSEGKLATDFSADAKNLCRPLVRDQFPKYRNKEQNDQLVKFIVSETFKSDEHYTSNQQKIDSTIQFLSEFDFTQSVYRTMSLSIYSKSSYKTLMYILIISTIWKNETQVPYTP